MRINSPAYKGVPLASCTLLELHRLDAANWSSVSYSFNRKEVKSHGEGGSIVGSPLANKNVLVIDDVITAGTAMRETLDLVAKEGGKVVGFVVAVDRQEKMPGAQGRQKGVNDGTSAMGQIKKEYGILTASIITLADLIDLMRIKGEQLNVERMEDYRKKYKADD